MVSWILFPLAGLGMGYLYFIHSDIHVYTVLIFTNLLIVTAVISILYLYTKHLRGMEFLNVSFGLGDILFFVALAVGFPTITFLILFVSSILFSLLIFFVIKNGRDFKNAPLAGLMSVFLIGTYVISSFPAMPSLYYL